MILKWIFDRVAALCGLLLIWWVFPLVSILIKVKMPGGPAFSVRSELERMVSCSHVISSAR